MGKGEDRVKLALEGGLYESEIWSRTNSSADLVDLDVVRSKAVGESISSQTQRLNQPLALEL